MAREQTYVVTVSNRRGELSIFGNKDGNPFKTKEMVERKVNAIKIKYPSLNVFAAPVQKSPTNQF